MKKIILITGANGMLAKYLTKLLENEYSLRFLTRNPTRSNEYLWNLENNFIDTEALKGVHTIIHLAGAPLADKRWTKQRKQLIITSRVNSSYLLFNELKKHQITIDTFISGSAIGYYGTTTTNNIFNEESTKGNDFLSSVCTQWEDAAHAYKLNLVASRVAVLRMGVILAKNDGALKKIIQPMRIGLGSGIGTGKQYMPWIHIQDLCSIFNFILKNKQISGTFNAVSPEHISNIELTQSIGRVLKLPLILPNIPKFIIQTLFGERSIILLNGSRVSSDKLSSLGFTFQFGNINDALEDILQTK